MPPNICKQLGAFSSSEAASFSLCSRTLSHLAKHFTWPPPKYLRFTIMAMAVKDANELGNWICHFRMTNLHFAATVLLVGPPSGLWQWPFQLGDVQVRLAASPGPQHVQIKKAEGKNTSTFIDTKKKCYWGKKNHNIIINRTRRNLERIWTYPTVIRIAGASINAITTPHFDGWIQRFNDSSIKLWSPNRQPMWIVCVKWPLPVLSWFVMPMNKPNVHFFSVPGTIGPEKVFRAHVCKTALQLCPNALSNLVQPTLHVNVNN